MSPWRVYLSGEIHTDWREQIEAGTKAAGLPVEFSAPVTNHGYSDDCGVAILGAEETGFWKDNKGAKVNAIRTRTLIEKSDIVIVRFGDKYKQWNAAFDAGFASALGKPLITSNWEILRQTFSQGTVHVDNSPSEIAKAVETIASDVSRYSAEMAALAEIRAVEFDAQLRELMQKLAV